MSEQILYSLVLIVLLFSSIEDVRHGKISLYGVIFGSAAAVMIQLVYRHDFTASLIGALIGILMLITARMTRQAVGYGDGAVFLFIGVSLGWKKCMEILMMSLLLISIAGVFMIAAGRVTRKTKWPMLPWILISSVIGVML